MNNAWLGREQNGGHYFLIIVTVFTAIFGIIMQYSASMYSAMRDMGDAYYYVKKQTIALVFGIVAMVFFSRVRGEILRRYRYHILIVSAILLALVFVPGIGVEKYGAKRWLNLGVTTIQPSEIAKIALVIFISGEMYTKSANTISGMVTSIVATLIICILIMLEPNMSITACVGLVALIMIFLGGAKSEHFAMMILPLLIIAPLLVVLEPYRLRRLVAYIDPWASPQGEGYQLIQSYYALGSGGMFGVGLFNSRQKYLFLPFAESDFIFSIIGEELGLVGSAFVMLLFLAIVVYGLITAIRATNRFDSYLAGGISVLIAIQTMLNIAVVSGSIPPTGLPLPLISHGGSSLVVYMSGIGMIRGVAIRTNEGILHTMK